MQALSSQCCLHLQGHEDPSDLSDLDDIEEAIDNELPSLSNPQSGEGKGTKVMEAFGLSDICYVPSFLRADNVMVDNWNHISRCILQRGTS